MLLIKQQDDFLLRQSSCFHDNIYSNAFSQQRSSNLPLTDIFPCFLAFCKLGLLQFFQMKFINHPRPLVRRHLITADGIKELLNGRLLILRLINFLIQGVIDGPQPVSARLRGLFADVFWTEINHFMRNLVQRSALQIMRIKIDQRNISLVPIS